MDGMKIGKPELTEKNPAAKSFDIRKIFDSDGDTDWEDAVDNEDIDVFDGLGPEIDKISGSQVGTEEKGMTAKSDYSNYNINDAIEAPTNIGSNSETVGDYWNNNVGNLASKSLPKSCRNPFNQKTVLEAPVVYSSFRPSVSAIIRARKVEEFNLIWESESGCEVVDDDVEISSETVEETSHRQVTDGITRLPTNFPTYPSPLYGLA